MIVEGWDEHACLSAEVLLLLLHTTAGSVAKGLCGRVQAALPLAASRWVRRLCHRDVELPRHTVPATHAFVTAALAGMGWGLHPEVLIAPYLAEGSLIELVPDTALDVPLHWQHARAASSLIDGLSRAVVDAAARALRPR